MRSAAPGRPCRPRFAPRVAASLMLLGAGVLAAPAPASSPDVPTAGGQPGDFDELLHLLAARGDGRVAYTEVHEMAMLERPLTSSGELVYRAPDHLEKRTLTPRPETLILDHGVLRAQRGQRTRVAALRDFPQLVPFIESIRATLAGDRAALEHFFHVEFSGSLEHWTLHLVPADAGVAHTVTEIRIGGERDAIRSVEIRQADGDRSLLTVGPALPQ